MTGSICFYHAPCNDGAGAAAALEHRIRRRSPDAVIELHPMSFTSDWDDPLREDYLDRFDGESFIVRAVYIVDISLSPVKYRQVLERLRALDRIGEEPPRVICIDHHRTALDNIETLREYCDETMIEIGPGLSGATLVWEYFNRTFEESLPTPELLRYIADQDIWEWKLDDSKAVNAALNTLDGHAEAMSRELAWSLRDESEWRRARTEQGEAILSVINAQLMKSFSRVMELYAPDGLHVRVVNATENSSELGNMLCEESHQSPNVLAVIFGIQRDWSIKCSLRTIDGGSVTARAVAERFGGGGHDNAAGCRFESLGDFQRAVATIVGSPEE